MDLSTLAWISLGINIGVIVFGTGLIVGELRALREVVSKQNGRIGKNEEQIVTIRETIAAHLGKCLPHRPDA